MCVEIGSFYQSPCIFELKNYRGFLSSIDVKKFKNEGWVLCTELS